jgi:uncharacterized membrane protein
VVKNQISQFFSLLSIHKQVNSSKVKSMQEVSNLPVKQTQSENAQASDTERWSSLIGGGALVLMGLRERSLKGVLMAIAGSGLIYQGVKNQSTIEKAQEALKIAPSSDRSIKVEKTVTINKPAEELYRYWHDFTNLPRFMKHIKSVTVYDDKRSHWVASAPLDTTVEWDAQIIKDEPNQLIAWTSVEGADIDNSGFVRFQPATGDRGTEVKVVMEYNPIAGEIGTAIAKLLGEEPEQRIGDELHRFKQLMETGEIATTEGQPKGG